MEDLKTVLLTTHEADIVATALRTSAVLWRHDPYYQRQIAASESFTRCADIAEQIILRLT